MTPGLGIATVLFGLYLGYDYYYNAVGPGKEEKLKWDAWLKERNERMGVTHGDDNHGAHHNHH